MCLYIYARYEASHQMLGVGGAGLDWLAAEREGVTLLIAPDSDGLGDDAHSGGAAARALSTSQQVQSPNLGTDQHHQPDHCDVTATTHHLSLSISMLPRSLNTGAVARNTTDSSVVGTGGAVGGGALLTSGDYKGAL